MPPHDKSMSKDSHFDNFSYHTDTKLKVYAINEEGKNTWNEPISKVNKCLENIGLHAEVKTWYGITYSSNF